MSMNIDFAQTEPARNDIDALAGATVIEFGTPWCGYCQAAQPILAIAFNPFPDIRHIKIEDGSGRPLGRSFKVKLWPTLIFMRDGHEVARLVRPTNAEVIRDALAEIAS